MRIVAAFVMGVLAMTLAALPLGAFGIIIAIVAGLFALVFGLPVFVALERYGQRTVWPYIATGVIISLPLPALVLSWQLMLIGSVLATIGSSTYWWAAIHIPSRPGYDRASS